MKFKMTAVMVATIAMSCNTSYGFELLDRLLGRAGCSSCDTAAQVDCGCETACDTGCGGNGGLMENLLTRTASDGGCSFCDAGDTIVSVRPCDEGCSSCGNAVAAPAGDCGCGGAVASDCGCGGPAVSDCGCADSGTGLNLGSKLFSRFGKSSNCGCGSGSVIAPSCGCDVAPANDCGCEAAPVETSCGCDAAPVTDCGCNVAPVADCGCDAAPACGGRKLNLFSRLKGGNAGCGCDAVPSFGCEAAPVETSCGCEAAPVTDCGCDIAPVADCGCDAAPACGGSKLNLFSRLKGGNAGCGCEVAPSCGCEAAPVETSCGCDAAPVTDCGCDVAPVADCGCGVAPAAGRKLGLFSRFKKASSVGGCGCDSGYDGGCGCDAAPVSDCGCGAPVADCGCDTAPAVGCGCGVSAGGCGCNTGCGNNYVAGRLTLLDRLRGNRVPRTRAGVVIGVNNDGCCPPCPQQSACNTCGGGEVVYSDAQPVSGCSSCGGGEAVYSEATPAYGETYSAPVSSVPSEAAPQETYTGATEGVVEPGDEVISDEQPSVSDDAAEGEASPTVDPGAFVPRYQNQLGS